MRAKKSLGQHFLKSEKALRAIVEAGKIEPTDCILEIGPGTGALTEKLLQTGAKVIAIEKDDELSLFLKEIYKKEIEGGKFEIINDDILDFDLSKLEAKSYKLVANIPYNITGLIFKKFLETDNQPKIMVLLVQKEVAQRIVAKDKKESVLSISIKAYGGPRFVEKVLAGSFSPPPKVDSAIIAIDDISKDFFNNFSEKDFFEMLHTGFKSKRKKLSSNLSVLFKKEKVLETFKTLGLDKNLRAEDVDLETWKKLSGALLNAWTGSLLGH